MSPAKAFTCRERGFSLIELMVGIVVALIAVVVVMQVFRLSESSRRTTTGGDDAQTTGIISLTVLQRHVQQAGQGFSSELTMGCDINLRAGIADVTNAGGITINHPIIPAGDANTDTLLIFYGSSNGATEGLRINTQPGAATYAVASAQTFTTNDWVMAARSPRPAPCALSLTQVTAEPVGSNVTVATGMPGASNGGLFNLGQRPAVLAYAIRNGQLTQCDFQTQDCTKTDAANWPAFGEGVVSLRAEYAKDTNKDSVVDTFDQATPTTVCGWYQTAAVRLGLLVRSGQLEKEDVAQAAPSWEASASAQFVAPGSDWQRYRYKTFETTVPLRNIGWVGVPTSC